MNIVKTFANAALVISAVLSLSGNAQAQYQQVRPHEKDPASKAVAVINNVALLHSYVNDLEESKKLEEAMEAERKKLRPGETRTFEVVSTGGPILSGGKFVRVQEVKKGQKLSEAGIFVSKPQTIGGGLPLPSNDWTPEQKQEMQQKAQKLKSGSSS